MITRRRTLKTLALVPLATGFSIGLRYPSLAQSENNRLRIPEQTFGNIDDNIHRFQLNLQRGTSVFLSDRQTDTFGINGNYLGPTLRFKRNQEIGLSVTNELGEPTTLHWHGFHLPATEDGGPHQLIENSDTWNSQFKVTQFAGTFWYHSHALHRSGEQVYKGLAGMIIVEDDEQGTGLPDNYGIDDIPLIVQDRRFNEDGSLDYMSRYEDSVMGLQGDTILVNGTLNAHFQASTRLVRFRILNGSNARTYRFAFDNNRNFLQIGSDGGLLESPVNLDQLELAPAERAEIVVQFNPGESLKLLSIGRPSSFTEFPGAMSRMMRSLNAQNFDILSLSADPQLDDNGEIPRQLTSISRLPESNATNSRSFLLSMGAGRRSGGDRGPGTGTRNGLGGGYGGGNFTINGRRIEENFINERIGLNTTEIWELNNNSPMMHPFHVHNGQFQVLDRNGNSPPANEMGWKDTVKVGSGETVRIIKRFADFSEETNPYMYHCHILEHEDRGMMGQFLVV